MTDVSCFLLYSINHNLLENFELGEEKNMNYTNERRITLIAEEWQCIWTFEPTVNALDDHKCL